MSPQLTQKLNSQPAVKMNLQKTILFFTTQTADQLNAVVVELAPVNVILLVTHIQNVCGLALEILDLHQNKLQD